MQKSGYLLVLTLLLITSCGHKKDVLPGSTLLSRGTVVLVFNDKDSILMAADSRSERVVSNRASEFSDTTNKIFRIGKVFFTAAGTTVFKNQSVQAIIRRYYRSSESILSNCQNLDKLIAYELQQYFNNLDPVEKKRYTDEAVSNTLITVIAAAYEKNSPLACSMTIAANLHNGKIAVNAGPVTKDEVASHMQSGGLVEMVYNYPYNYMNKSSSRLKDLFYLIGLEAHYHPKQVDTLINYAIIKRNGFRVGKNY
jgi:hypothetical protein